MDLIERDHQYKIDNLEKEIVNNKVQWAKVGGISSALTAVIFIVFKVANLI
jgi:hypothetical protein